MKLQGTPDLESFGGDVVPRFLNPYPIVDQILNIIMFHTVSFLMLPSALEYL